MQKLNLHNKKYASKYANSVLIWDWRLLQILENEDESVVDWLSQNQYIRFTRASVIKALRDGNFKKHPYREEKGDLPARDPFHEFPISVLDLVT